MNAIEVIFCIFISLVIIIILLFIILSIKQAIDGPTEYDLEKIKELKLEDGIYVDIGYLGYEEHENAFVDIFETVFMSNKGTVKCYKTIEIQKMETDIANFYKNLRKYAKYLYNLREARIFLKLRGKNSVAYINVEFDNPNFYLENIDMLPTV